MLQQHFQGVNPSSGVMTMSRDVLQCSEPHFTWQCFWTHQGVNCLALQCLAPRGTSSSSSSSSSSS
eukprot:4284061-Amphidinium_carterae.1